MSLPLAGSNILINDPTARNSNPFDRSLVTKEISEYQKLCTLNPFGVNLNEYLAMYPRKKRTQLSSCKSALYNPRLPSIKQMWHDDVLCKLPDEHSRHTTWLTKSEFDSHKFYSRKTPTKNLTSLEFSESGRNLLRNSQKDVVEYGLKKHNINYDPKDLEDNEFVENSFNSMFTTSNYIPRIKTTALNERWRFNSMDYLKR